MNVKCGVSWEREVNVMLYVGLPCSHNGELVLQSARGILNKSEIVSMKVH